jgi:hypothetical protein
MFSIESDSGAGDRSIIVRMHRDHADRFVALLGLSMWSSGGYELVRGNGAISSEVGFICEVTLWLAGEIISLLAVLWLWFGYHTLTLKRETLIVKQKIGPITVGKPNSFTLPDINNLRIGCESHNRRGSIITTYTIVFDYRGQKNTLLHFLSKQQAEFLLSNALPDLLVFQPR